ncbi:MAG: RluA family pseudouridine synthase [Peptoniphilaceae bacterium]|nr:RluA family pseudouridine synthase [Peptoniphilaceae bacterium]MDY6086015.1 RluA family pseudouridine synthase [Peptoniphilaceae bacterium]
MNGEERRWRSVVIDPESDAVGLRADAGAAALFDGYSRSKLAQAIKEGRLVVNQETVRPKTILCAGDVISYDPTFFDLAPLRAEPFALPLLYEDDDLLVVNKPAGLVTHPTPQVRQGTVVNQLMGSGRRFAVGDDAERPGIVHRLDAQTSGCLIVAKTETARDGLVEAFRNHQVKKRYLAMVETKWDTEGTLVDLPIGRDPKDPKRRTVRTDGREAKSLFRTREMSDEASLMDVRIFTGRTHQIRVHARAQEHPVVGDTLYGFRRQRHETGHHLLHAWQIAFAHPRTGEWIHVAAPWDDEWERMSRVLSLPLPETTRETSEGPFDLSQPDEAD